jgi:tetratricopeptide (TPR) repeat protein
MPPDSGLHRLLAELKRRRVFHTAAAYGAAAFFTIEGADLVLPRIGLPDSAVTAVVWLALAGFPVALALSWRFERREGGLDVTAPATEDELSEIAAQPRLRRWPVGLLALVGSTMLAVGAWLALASRGPGASVTDVGEGDAIAVLPFSVRGGADYAYLSSGLVDLLTTRMDGVGRIRTVPARAVLGLVSQEGAGTLDEGSAARVASALGARRYVIGRIIESGGRLSITADIHDLSTPGGPNTVTVEGSDQELFSMVDQLTTRLVAGLERSAEGRVRQLAALTTGSLPALRSYLEGEALLRAGQFTAALAAFEEATAIDSTFALAHYRTSIAREWGSQSGATEAAEAAYRHAARLSERDRLLVEAMWSWRQGDGVRAEDLYRTVLGTWPDDVEAWLQLAEVLNHLGPMRGGSISDSRNAFERVLRFEPEHLLSHWHVARIDAVEGRFDSLDARIELIRDLSPDGDRTLELMAMRAAAHDPEAWPAVVDSLQGAQDITRYFAAWNVSVFAQELDRALVLVPVLIQTDRSREVQATGHLLDAFFSLARGRPGDSEAAMGRLQALDPDLATSHSAALSLLPFMDADAATLESHLEEVRQWMPEAGCLSPHPVRNFEPGTCIRPVVRSYLAGMLEARLGRAEGARRSIAEVQAFADAGQDQGHGVEYAAEIEAEVALQRGDTTAALQALEASPGHVWYIHALQSFLYSHAQARFRRAQTLEALGREAEAIQWYSSFDEMSQYDLVLLGPALTSAGRVAESLGRTDEAASYFERAARYLDGSEGPLETVEQEALEGLGRLSAGHQLDQL